MLHTKQFVELGFGWLMAAFILSSTSISHAQVAGPKVAEIREMLEDYHPEAQKKALDAIASGTVEQAEELIPDVTRLLAAQTDNDVRASAVSAVLFLESQGNEIVSGLIRSAQGSDRGEQMGSIKALAHLGPRGVDGLVQILNGNNAFAQQQAAFALTKFASTVLDTNDKRPVLKELVAALYHVDPNASGHLCRALLDLGDDAVTELAKDYASGEEMRRLKALKCLVEFDVHAAKIVPNLITVLEDANDSLSIRKWTAAALGNIGKESEKTVPTLVRWLSNENSEIQFGCLRGLAAVGPRAQVAVPELIRFLEMHKTAKRPSDTALPMEAAAAIAGIGPAAVSAVPALRTMLMSKDRGFPGKAIAALSAIGPAAASASDDLNQILSTGDENLRGQAAYALGRINPEPGEGKYSIPEKYKEMFDRGRRDARDAVQRTESVPNQTGEQQAAQETKPSERNSIRVEVFGTNRQRIKGAKATYSQRGTSKTQLERISMVAESDDLGILYLKNLPAGEGSLTVYAEGHEPSLMGGLGRLGLPTIEVELKEASPKQVTVVDNTGAPVTAATVTVDKYRSMPLAAVKLITDAEGKFEFCVGHGFVSGIIVKEGFMQHRFQLDSKSKDKTVTLHAPYHIVGTVVDADSGEKIPSFEIKRGFLISGKPEFFDDDSHANSLGKFSNGAYEIRVTESSDKIPGLFDHQVLGVDAPQYRRSVSPRFTEGNGDIELNFKLTKQ